MTIKRLTKVWPIKAGTPGYTARQEPIRLQPGVPGYMDWDDAMAAERTGLVDIMMGKTPQSLRKPIYETRVATAAPDPEPEPEPEPEPPATPAAEEGDPVTPKTPKKVVPSRAPRRKYRRTDMKAES